MTQRSERSQQSRLSECATERSEVMAMSERSERSQQGRLCECATERSEVMA